MIYIIRELFKYQRDSKTHLYTSSPYKRHVHKTTSDCICTAAANLYQHFIYIYLLKPITRIENIKFLLFKLPLILSSILLYIILKIIPEISLSGLQNEHNYI